MRLIYVILLLLLIPTVSADNVSSNVTDNQTANVTVAETVYNPEVLIDADGNFNTSSILFSQFINQNFGNYIEIMLSIHGINETYWCHDRSVVRLADGVLYNLHYNNKTMDCEGDFKIKGTADFSKFLAVDEIRDALISEQEKTCEESREYDIDRIDNLKLMNMIYLVILGLFIVCLTIKYVMDRYVFSLKI